MKANSRAYAKYSGHGWRTKPRHDVQRTRQRSEGGSMNRALPPRDRGHRTAVARWPSGHRGLMSGAVRLAHGIANDSKHAVRYAACKFGSLYMGVELNGRGPGLVPVTLPGVRVSRSGWTLSCRSRNRHAHKRMSEERLKLNVWTRPQER